MVPPTVPMDVFLNLASGAGLALAAGGPSRRGMAVTLVFHLGVFVPLGAFLALRFPDWSWMYLLDAAAMPWTVPVALALYASSGLAGYLAGARLLGAARRRAALGFVAGGLAGSAMVGVVGMDRLLHVGTLAEWQSSTADLAWQDPVWRVALPVLSLMCVTGYALALAVVRGPGRG
ncbi:MAG: hypothetical protein HY722_09640 [Planctomycetes bacterium]|nr:hypothetical protein [Planctomycetota bacterium]